MNDPELMTVEEFNNRVSKWAMTVRQQARATLAQTKGSGRLAMLIDKFTDKLSDHDPVYKIKFNFLRYGVYRAYGAGRGYVIVNGLPVRGSRLRSDKAIRKDYFSLESGKWLKKGYSVSQINKAKMVDNDNTRIARAPLNWIDKHIEGGVQPLADLVQGFYGDEALRQMLKNFNNLKIIKK